MNSRDGFFATFLPLLPCIICIHVLILEQGVVTPPGRVWSLVDTSAFVLMFLSIAIVSYYRHNRMAFRLYGLISSFGFWHYFWPDSREQRWAGDYDLLMNKFIAETIAFSLFCYLLADLIPRCYDRWNVGERFRPNECQECGYNLTGLVSPRCPECGTAFEPIESLNLEVSPPKPDN